MDSKKSFPAEGELVLCEITNIQSHCAFAKLKEYENLEGMIHISEVASSWVKDIRAHVKEGKTVVCKVTRINPERKHITLSVRRVSEADRTKKFDSIKRRNKCEHLSEQTARKLGISCEEFLSKYEGPLRKEFAEVYFAFEEGARNGAKALEEKKIPKEVAEAVAEVGKKSITFSKVFITGNINLSCKEGDGVERVKKVLMGIEKIGAKLSYISAPHYKLFVEEDDYKRAERKLKEIIDCAESLSKENGCEMEFERK